MSSSGNGVDSASATSSNSEASNNIGTHLQEIVSQLANDNDITKKVDALLKITRIREFSNDRNWCKLSVTWHSPAEK